MSGITKTIPAGAGFERLDSLFDGTISEYEFHMAGTPSKLEAGDYVYAIFGDFLYGRIMIDRIVSGAVHPKSGRPRSLIYVSTPGERLEKPVPKKGHRGTRYYDGTDWGLNS
ncbi:MAG: hypothetical protein ACI9FB_000059 [Candidatus Azotimanducaceae bacterium]|jgi:hypothetical protein